MNKHRDFETIYRATFNTLSKHVYFKEYSKVECGFEKVRSKVQCG